jgi:exopolyphosphatase/guanosine-5'-triphosphate,3'-diphosphate pyrophosphatase
VNPRGHHKHGEYLVRHADLPGLGGHQQAVLACLVRYHGKATPEPHHRLYRSLSPSDRQRVRQLAGLLRIAVALDAGRAQAVRRVETQLLRNTIWLRVIAAADAHVDLGDLRRKARFFESEFNVRLRLGRVKRLAPAPAERGVTRMRRAPTAITRRSAA